jgi:DNA-binding CsgD family transcriptional regulator
MLARVCGTSFTAARMIEFAEEIAARLRVDAFVVLHYPRGASPRLLHGRMDDRHRAGSENELCFRTDDGLGGHLSLSLSRAVGKERFSRAELEAARVIAPLVNAALSSTWRDLAPGGAGADPDPDEAHHRHIAQARMNFGRSVLTEREFQILQELLQGKSVGLVARRLKIAASTVKVHRKHIYSKLGINSQAELFTLFLEVIAGARGDLGSGPLESHPRPRPKAI